MLVRLMQFKWIENRPVFLSSTPSRLHIQTWPMHTNPQVLLKNELNMAAHNNNNQAECAPYIFVVWKFVGWCLFCCHIVRNAIIPIAWCSICYTTWIGWPLGQRNRNKRFLLYSFARWLCVTFPHLSSGERFVFLGRMLFVWCASFGFEAINLIPNIAFEL